MFYFKKTPWILKSIYPHCVWNIKTDEKILYLTFDDGPHPQATPFVLDQLKKYNAKATFFCLGKNVKEDFEVYKQMIVEGHRPGNHTYSHLNGWTTKNNKYIEDITAAAKVIDSKLFRPPYGRITSFQIKTIAEGNLGLRTVMWDVLSGDFDTSISAEKCYLNVINNAKQGAIIVFHDSQKSFNLLKETLPKVLKFYNEKGFQFKILPQTL